MKSCFITLREMVIYRELTLLIIELQQVEMAHGLKASISAISKSA